MKLLYLVSRWGEPTETFVRREIAAGTAAGHDIQVVSLKPPRPVPDGPPVIHLQGTAVVTGALHAALRHPIRALRLFSLLRGSTLRNLPRHAYALAVALAIHGRVHRPDWVHAHFAWLSATTAWGVSTLLDVPFGVMPHAHDIYERDLVDDLLRRKLRAASLVVVESERIRDDVAVSLGCDASVLRMGVPGEYVRRRHPHVGRGVRIVSVGALRPKKGHDVLVEAIAGIPGAQLRIVGDGPERDRLTELIGHSAVSDRVHLLGHLPEDDVTSELDQADVFALASRITSEGDRDGVPNVLIEAMARGVPVVSTDVAGIPDLLLPDRGTVVPSEDEPALRAAVVELLEDPELRARRSTAAQAHVGQHYTVASNWARLEGLITAATECRGQHS